MSIILTLKRQKDHGFKIYLVYTAKLTKNKKSTERNILIYIFKNIFNMYVYVPCVCRKPEKSEGVIRTLEPGVRMVGWKFLSQY